MKLPFVSGYAEQYYLTTEEGLDQAILDKADYWYIDGSLPSEYPLNWISQRIDALNAKIEQFNVKPVFHGNFKLPLSSDVESVREISVQNVYREIDLSAELSAPLIVHGGAIVEPRLVIKAKKDGLSAYLKSIDSILTYATKKKVTILCLNRFSTSALNLMNTSLTSDFLRIGYIHVYLV